MRIKCPGCGETFETDARSGGVPCPRCGRKVPAEAFAPTVDIPPQGAAPEAPDAGPGAGTPLFRDSPRYRLLGELGRGGMGVVYKAHDSKLNRLVALKVLIAGEGASEEEVKRFFQEATSAARLRHPNIVPIHELDVQEGRHYFTMDYVEGGPLSKLIAERGLTPRRAVEIVMDVAAGVHHAHEQGIIHRDLKPANIILTPDGRPMVMDFGLAKQVESDTKLTRSGVAMGTPAYMSPEQAKGETQAADARTDVWALGAVLYEMLTGLPPFAGATSFEIIEKVVYEDPIPPRRYSRACPQDVETICLKCLEKDPRRRYQTAEALAEDCRRFLEGEPISARPASIIYRARKRLARHRAVAAVTAVAAAALVALAAWSYARIVRERDAAVAARKKEAKQRTLAEQKQNEAESARREAEEARRAEEEQRKKAEAALEAERELQRLGHELNVAMQIQARLLPPRIPQIPGYDFYPFYRSCKEVGGDYYDFFPIGGERLAMVVADVSGKGIPGSLVMAPTRTMFRILGPQCGTGDETLRQTNAYLANDIKRGMFVTAILAILKVRTREMSVCSAGHNPMVLFRERTGECELVNPPGVALGIYKGPVFDKHLRQELIKLFPGDRVVMYTDGVVEALNEQREEYGDERFYEFVREHARTRSKDFVRALVRELDEHRGNAAQHDDITISTFRIEGGQKRSGPTERPKPVREVRPGGREADEQF